MEIETGSTESHSVWRTRFRRAYGPEGNGTHESETQRTTFLCLPNCWSQSIRIRNILRPTTPIKVFSHLEAYAHIIPKLQVTPNYLSTPSYQNSTAHVSTHCLQKTETSIVKRFVELSTQLTNTLYKHPDWWSLLMSLTTSMLETVSSRQSSTLTLIAPPFCLNRLCNHQWWKNKRTKILVRIEQNKTFSVHGARYWERRAKPCTFPALLLVSPISIFT